MKNEEKRRKERREHRGRTKKKERMQKWKGNEENIEGAQERRECKRKGKGKK